MEEGGFAKEAAQVPYQELEVEVCYYACSPRTQVKSERTARLGTRAASACLSQARQEAEEVEEVTGAAAARLIRRSQGPYLCLRRTARHLMQSLLLEIAGLRVEVAGELEL